ncbi:ester cyclase [Halorussus sp. MSC15.2]|uniref:ester cyclase n=1 Tax=Halorussus sp. MSC15.2 TaxID=2283638 RepID=UPI0013D4C624|nr:ester cyclase [Halorussus sp. MSC15.2]NEU58774.1 ester cyclase [Halorussus sp. MSC15.2]
MATEVQSVKDVVRRYTEDGYNDANPAIIEETVAEDVVVHGLPGADGPVRGVDAYLEWAGELLKAIPDAHAEIEALLAEENMAAVHWTMSGTQEGELGDLPPTGEPFSMRALALFRFEDGQIAEKWYVADEVSMLEQLGLTD